MASPGSIRVEHSGGRSEKHYFSESTLKVLHKCRMNHVNRADLVQKSHTNWVTTLARPPEVPLEVCQYLAQLGVSRVDLRAILSVSFLQHWDG